MRISVAMATYNGQRFLGEQLDSLLVQTVLPAELVVSDDGSDDDTIRIIQEFARRAPFPVRILEKDERLGFSDNFLHCAAACDSELVAFCDQDDVWLPKKLEMGLARLQADDSLLSLHRLTMTDGALQPTGLWTQGIEGDAVFAACELDPYTNGWGNTMMFRRALVTAIARERRPRQPDRPERPLSHDTWIYVLAAALGRTSHIAAPLILYRQHGSNTMGIQRPGVLGKIKARLTLSMGQLRERMVFYNAMIELFSALAQEPESPFAAAAAQAAACYTARWKPLADRLEIYYGASLGRRLRAYRALPRQAGRGAKSVAKDMVLGVSGLHAFFE